MILSVVLRRSWFACRILRRASGSSSRTFFSSRRRLFLLFWGSAWRGRELGRGRSSFSRLSSSFFRSRRFLAFAFRVTCCSRIVGKIDGRVSFFIIFLVRVVGVKFVVCSVLFKRLRGALYFYCRFVRWVLFFSL